MGETPEERVAALEALADGARRVRPPAGGDPPELRAAPALLRRRAGGDRGRGAAHSGPRRARGDAGLGHPISLDDMRLLVRECRRLMPDVGVQIPPNLSDWWLPLVEEGATDLGGLSANGDHISPEHPFPSRAPDAEAAPAARLRAHRAALRVPAVHGPGLARAGRARRDQAALLELHPAARVGPAGGAADPPRPRAGRGGPRPRGRGADRRRS